MRRFLIVVTLILLATLLTGCPSTPIPSASGASAAPTIDISKLADTVDVATVNALRGRSDVLMIDVREQSEYDAGHIPNITLIPMNQVPNRLSEIPKDKPVIVTCRSGNRSDQVTTFLRQQGYTNIHNMAGGIVAWQQAGYAVEK